jgi:hypothetical protein
MAISLEKWPFADSCVMASNPNLARFCRCRRNRNDVSVTYGPHDAANPSSAGERERLPRVVLAGHAANGRRIACVDVDRTSGIADVETVLSMPRLDTLLPLGENSRKRPSPSEPSLSTQPRSHGALARFCRCRHCRRRFQRCTVAGPCGFAARGESSDRDEHIARSVRFLTADGRITAPIDSISVWDRDWVAVAVSR